MPASSGWKIGVVTTFVPDAEPLEMLEETIRALLALDYPHDTWVLDEGNDDRVKALCRRCGALYFSRKSLPHYQTNTGQFKSHSKHGNYNAWLHEIGFSRYDIVTTFDPDHVPAPTFLTNVLGYFDDPNVAYVQVAQAYYNQEASFIARGAAEETYDYYSAIQMASYGMGYPIIVGCHNTHRVSALKQVGGFAAHDADDLLLTLRYRSSAWQGIYLPRILARGLAPVDWRTYLTQQRRWARSVLDIKFRFYPQLAKDLSLSTHVMSFLHGLNYVHRSIIILTGIILLACMLVTGVTPQVISYSILPKLALLCGVLQLCQCYRQRFYLDWHHERGFHWRAGLLHLAKWPYHLLAMCDVIFNRGGPYALTLKVQAPPVRYMLLWPHMLVSVALLISCITGIWSGRVMNLLLYIGAAIIISSALTLVVSEHLNFPAPYSKRLAMNTLRRQSFLKED